MDNLALSEEYFEKARVIKEEHDKIASQFKGNMPHMSLSNQIEAKNRMRILFDMYLDCKIVGTRLKRIYLRQNKNTNDMMK